MSVRLRINRNGQVTLSGINYSDLRSILNEAWLYRFDNPVRQNPEEGPMADVIRDNNLTSKGWEKKLMALTRMLSDQITAEINRINGVDCNRPKTIEERWESVRLNQKLDQVLGEAMAEMERKQG